MVTVLSDQVVGVSGVVQRLALHKFTNLIWIQTCHAHEDRLPKSEAWTSSRLDLENTTGRIAVNSESILHTINCKHGFTMIDYQQHVSLKHRIIVQTEKLCFIKTSQLFEMC